MVLKQVIFEPSTSFLTCGTLKHTALVFYPHEPSATQNCQIMICFLKHKTKNTCWFLQCHASSQILQKSQYLIHFVYGKVFVVGCWLWFFFKLSPQCFIFFWPMWFVVQAAAALHALPEDVLCQCAMGDFWCTSPDALYCSKLNCSMSLAQQIIPIPDLLYKITGFQLNRDTLPNH